MTLGVLAAAAASSSTSDDVEPGVLAFLVVAAMGVALVFLLRSMNKQFRKIDAGPGHRRTAGGGQVPAGRARVAEGSRPGTARVGRG